uniref:Uncharacterized protein n=1 Tax=Sphaerodactylus townsendi TaxID=933632 RepID=A0ACB8G2V3_9SAUR
MASPVARERKDERQGLLRQKQKKQIATPVHFGQSQQPEKKKFACTVDLQQDKRRLKTTRPGVVPFTSGDNPCKPDPPCSPQPELASCHQSAAARGIMKAVAERGVGLETSATPYLLGYTILRPREDYTRKEGYHRSPVRYEVMNFSRLVDCDHPWPR